jgi:hypothetical protein
MSALREAAQQALEALEETQRHRAYTQGIPDAITALRAALAQEEQEQEPVAWMHKETDLLRRDWDLLKETQAALRDAWAILKKLKAVQDAARELVEYDPDSAAYTEGAALAAWCALVAAIDDADTLLCEFGERRKS